MDNQQEPDPFQNQLGGEENRFIRPNQDTLLRGLPQGVPDYDSTMFSSLGLKGNIHSALFDPFSNQPPFLSDPFAFQAPKVGLVDSLPPYIGVRPEAPFNYCSSRSVYSTSGFNLLKILSYLVNRPNPTINIGPVDLSCAFLLVDARKYDFPIVYSSPAFQTLTGYDTHEVVGRNCRFLQAPSGNVASGSRRKYTDNQQVFTIKSQLLNAKETQLSIVNYKKNGQPFINLFTMIPVFERGAVVYFVGLQIDMVEQPSAIIDSMNVGKYMLSYGIHTFTKTVESESPEAELNFFGPNLKPPKFDRNEVYSQAEIDWTRLLLENTSDFIHVLSLKGSFLYASPNTIEMFGYTPSELAGSSLNELCHPGDLVPVLRDLRVAAASETIVSLAYRFKLAHGGYVWLDSFGKINSEFGKGRRCAILSSRIRPVYQLSKELMLSCGGQVTTEEYWSKISSDGLILYLTPSCSEVLGYQPDELTGISLYQFVHPDNIITLTSSLVRAGSGNVAYLAYQFQGKKGTFLDVNTIIYPKVSDSPSTNKPAFFICRTRLASSPEIALNTNLSDESVDMFDILSSDATSSWQYELQQLRLKNRLLREEIDTVAPNGSNKRRHTTSDRHCLACLRTTTTEWRRGPEGPSTLCNPCGLKHAKGISPYHHPLNPKKVALPTPSSSPTSPIPSSYSPPH